MITINDNLLLFIFFYEIKNFFNCVYFLMYRSLLKINTNNNYKVYNKIQSNNTRYLIILLVVNKTLTYIKNRNTYI